MYHNLEDIDIFVVQQPVSVTTSLHPRQGTRLAILQESGPFRPQTISSPSRFTPKTFPPPGRFAPLVVSPLVYIRSYAMSNLGLHCLHTAKIATYFKGVQVHNVLVLDYVTLETRVY